MKMLEICLIYAARLHVGSMNLGALPKSGAKVRQTFSFLQIFSQLFSKKMQMGHLGQMGHICMGSENSHYNYIIYNIIYNGQNIDLHKCVPNVPFVPLCSAEYRREQDIVC